MAKKVKQCRLSQSNATEMETFVDGSVFEGFYPMIQIGIQSIPNTKFYINDEEKTGAGIIIGSTGIFELESPLGTYIKDLRFDEESLKSLLNNQTESLIVDIIYEVEEDE